MRFSVVLAGLLGGAATVIAQTTPTTTIEETVVVTASLEPEEAPNVNATADIITAEEIRRRQVPAIADALATVPGLTLARAGSPGKVTSLFTRGTESDHTLVLWNGVELNNPFFGGFDWAFLSTEGVDRIEVVRGPFSSLYGSDALGGVVQVISRPARGGSLRLEAGERGYLRTGAQVGAELSAGAIQVMGHVHRDDGVLVNDTYDSEEVAVQAEWPLAESSRLGFVGRFNESDNGIPFSGGNPSPQRTLGWRESQLALPYSYRTGRWGITAHLSRMHLEQTFRDPDDPFGFTASDTEAERTRIRATARYRFAADGHLAFGAEQERAEVDDRSVFGTNLNGSAQNTGAVFAEWTGELPRMRWVAGVRHDDNGNFGTRTTPRLSALWSVGKGTRIRGSWGESFRAPSLGELFYPFSGNPDLQSEIGRSTELAVERDIGAWNYGIAAFDNRMTNLIEFDFATFTNRNVGEARSRGAEVWARYRNRTFDLSANATLLSAKDTTNDRSLLRRPEESASLVVSWHPERWLWNLTGRYVGARADIDAATLARVENPAYLRFDLATHFPPLGPVRPYARVENLTDRKYQEVAGFPAPGRRWIGGLAVNWK